MASWGFDSSVGPCPDIVRFALFVKSEWVRYDLASWTPSCVETRVFCRRKRANGRNCLRKVLTTQTWFISLLITFSSTDLNRPSMDLDYVSSDQRQSTASICLSASHKLHDIRHN